MAVIGRQKCQYALSSQQLIALSAPATLPIANSRASSARVSPSASATVRNVRLYISTVLTWNSARACCSGLRAPSTPPRSLTSLYSVVYSALSSAGGPDERNCDVLSSVNG